MPDTTAELLQLNQKLLECIAQGDWAAYQELCDPSLTAIEPESHGQIVEGLAFHRFYFDLGGIRGREPYDDGVKPGRAASSATLPWPELRPPRAAPQPRRTAGHHRQRRDARLAATGRQMEARPLPPHSAYPDRWTFR